MTLVHGFESEVWPVDGKFRQVNQPPFSGIGLDPQQALRGHGNFHRAPPPDSALIRGRYFIAPVQ